MRKAILLLILVLLTTLISCKEIEPKPIDQLDTYINLWNELNFTEMYNMLSNDTKETYTKQDFIDRYEKIYQDLNISEVKISASPIHKDQLLSAIEAKQTTVNIEAKMNSLAGDIQFSNTLSLVLDESDDESQNNWLIEWNPGLIFPELEQDGIITIEKHPPRRGEILDRNQMPLAINTIAYEVGIVPELITDYTNELKQISTLLNMSTAAIESSLNESWVEPHHFVPLKVIPDSAEYEIDILRNFASVRLNETVGRIYPSEEAAAHLTGYIGKITAEELAEESNEGYKDSDMIGKSGLELLLESRLRGSEGTSIIIKNESEDKIILAEDPVKHGENIQLTIDINIQERIFDSYGENAGTAAAIQPKTGEILALVSSPAFDPNDFIYGISNHKWDELLTNPDQPLINRFTATYAPGSVIKPVTAAIGLANDIITPDEVIEIDGLSWKKPYWQDFEIRRVSANLNKVDLQDAIVTSDNIYFAMKAIEMDNDAFINGFLNFGFSESMPIIYPISPSQVSNNNVINNEVLRANTSYGQGEMEVSSLHLATMYTTFLNEGSMIKPNLLLDDTTGDLWHEDLIDKTNNTLIKKYLRQVVTDGSAKRADEDTLEIAGKTGTAELKISQDSTGAINGWFVAYPSIKEDIIIAMMVEDTRDIGSTGYVVEELTNILLDINH